MKNLKKVLALGLSLGLMASAAVTANAGRAEDDYPAVKGNKYLISVDEYEDNGGTLEKCGCTEYTVDENHRVTSYILYDISGTEKTAQNITEYVLNADGSVKEESIFEIDDNFKKDPISTIAYEYDANGNIVKETTIDKETDTYHTDYITEKQYNANNQITYKKTTTYNDDGTVIYYTEYTYTYGINGLLEQELQSKNSINTYKRTYEYDADGREIFMYEDSYYEGTATWKKVQKGITTYSADGLTQTTEYYFSDDGVNYNADPRSRYTHGYDANGNEILDACSFDFGGGVMIETYHDVYEYDEFGNVLSETSLIINAQGGYDVHDKTVYNYGTYTVTAQGQAKSPKTADTTPVAIALTGVIALGALVVSKKKA